MTIISLMFCNSFFKMIQDVLGTDNGVERRYPPTIKKGFRITMARLDESTSDDSPAQVIC